MFKLETKELLAALQVAGAGECFVVVHPDMGLYRGLLRGWGNGKFAWVPCKAEKALADEDMFWQCNGESRSLEDVFGKMAGVRAKGNKDSGNGREQAIYGTGGPRGRSYWVWWRYLLLKGKEMTDIMMNWQLQEGRWWEVSYQKVLVDNYSLRNVFTMGMLLGKPVRWDRPSLDLQYFFEDGMGHHMKRREKARADEIMY